MRSKLISCVLAIAMLLTLSIPAFATDSQVSEYTFSDNVINAEVSDNGIQPFTSENIIVMTEAEALELGTGLRSIVQNCQLVYIDGDVNPVTIANSAGIPVPGEAVADSNDNTVKDIALAIKYVDGDFIIDETYIPSQGTSSTIDVGLDASAEGVGGSVGASWSYTSEAINVTNDFTEDDSRIWTFEPVKTRSGNALVQEPGIRSVSSGSGKKYTSIKLNCPFYGPRGIIFRNNNLYWHIAW